MSQTCVFLSLPYVSFFSYPSLDPAFYFAELQTRYGMIATYSWIVLADISWHATSILPTKLARARLALGIINGDPTYVGTRSEFADL